MTGKVVLREVEEFMNDYQPVYQPILPLFLAGKSQAWSEDVGTVDFKRVEAIGDIRAGHITPKDTEIKQISVGENKKTFKKYFFANQYVQSALQTREGVEAVGAQVLDEHWKQADELFLLGEGTAANNVLNNGLYWSADTNYVLENSKEIDNANGSLTDLHTQIMVSVEKANLIAGKKAIIFYGEAMLAKINSLYSTTNTPFITSLKAVIDTYSVVKMPSGITPSGENGWIIVNFDQVKLNYVKLPELNDQGVNAEKMYAWMNFLMGSYMLEVLALYGVIRQPVTFEA